MKKIKPIEIVDVFLLHERYFAIGGVWPLRKSYVKFAIYAVYCTIQITLAYIDLYNVIDDLHLMVENLLETLVSSLSLLMIIIIRFHPSLATLIVTIKNEIVNNGEYFENNEERSIYYHYNHISNTLSKIASTTSLFTITAMYLKPLPNILHALLHPMEINLAAASAATTNIANNTDIFPLPFKGVKLYHITNVQTYILLYIFQLPYIYCGFCHTVTTCVILTLVLHICGKLSMMRRRILMLDTKPKDQLNDAIRRHVQSHIQLIWMVKSIEKIFNVVILLDLVQNSIRLGLSSYVTLVSKDNKSEFVVMCTFASYAAVVFLLIFEYCFIGEYLMQESKKLAESYYHCNWAEMPQNCKTSLLICIICSQTYLNLTAGKFYTFSLYGFTGIVKTSMAYLSMLRTVI
ncbi:odorant receptor 13a-like isoform X1 [Vespa velutina]|uniref:odorant receptor 13a-like isoform X1 n=1 Tax=Vespa velutina TaxID=202808 RepID=UPI001FB37072|nr:odorant receptor 13a-like isoform X1 [Vespa velutina]